MSSPFNAGAVPESLRAAADTTLTKAREAVGQYTKHATEALEKVEGTMQTAQAGTTEFGRKAIGFAEANVAAAFDLAQKLVHAKTPQEMAAINKDYFETQFAKMKAQMTEIGSDVSQAVSKVTPKL